MRRADVCHPKGSAMEVNIEVPDLVTIRVLAAEAEEKRLISYATISDLYFEESDGIEEDELFSVLFIENGTCEIVAPVSRTLVSLPCEEGGSLISEQVLAATEMDR
ncbi:MAG: hypothetical protein JSU86_16920 [Phycisphaerales bacterium]|nr:MAG: hypothetical protein JSU86_16920 [Phycisphaerales bacterium]